VRHPVWPPGVEIIVIGRGAQQSEVIAAQKTGAPIRWLGYRPNQDIPKLIAGAIAGLVPAINPSGRASTGFCLSSSTSFLLVGCLRSSPTCPAKLISSARVNAAW
jgi:hypothetical protein